MATMKVSCRAVAVLVAVVCAGVGAHAQDPCEARHESHDGPFTCRQLFGELKRGGFRFPSRRMRTAFPKECGACRIPEPVVPESPCSREIRVQTFADAEGGSRTCHAFAETLREWGLAGEGFDDPSVQVAELHPECASSCRGSAAARRQRTLAQSGGDPCEARHEDHDGPFTCRQLFGELKRGGFRFPSRMMRTAFPEECGACRIPEPVVPESPCSRAIKVRTFADAEGGSRTCHALAETLREWGLAGEGFDDPSEQVAALHPECASSCRGSQ